MKAQQPHKNTIQLVALATTAALWTLQNIMFWNIDGAAKHLLIAAVNCVTNYFGLISTVFRHACLSSVISRTASGASSTISSLCLLGGLVHAWEPSLITGMIAFTRRVSLIGLSPTNIVFISNVIITALSTSLLHLYDTQHVG